MGRFKDVEFMTAKDKELVLKQWITFLKYGCRLEHFTKRLYEHLILHCSFIAHFNRHGFYGLYFIAVDGRKKFFSQFDLSKGAVSVEYGGTGWRNIDSDYADINTAMCENFLPPVDPFLLYLQERGVDDEKMGDVVHDLKSAEATTINNGGMERQLEYILKAVGSEKEVTAIFCMKAIWDGVDTIEGRAHE